MTEHDPTDAVPAEFDADAAADEPITTAHGAYAIAALVALIAGVVIGTVAGPQVPAVVAPYLPIAVVAAIDAVFGGVRAFLDGIFDAKVFVVSFVFNVLVAAMIVWLGDQLGVGTQLSTAIVVVLGIRIFGNAAALRRRLFGA
ncbi:MAG: small basic family protein [Rhodococcus sp. (in: high G+C Gram-positive bacteria)]